MGTKRESILSKVSSEQIILGHILTDLNHRLFIESAALMNCLTTMECKVAHEIRYIAVRLYKASKAIDQQSVESIDIETTNYSKTTRIWPHNMLLWLPEITIDRGHSPKAYSPKADSEHRHLHIQHNPPRSVTCISKFQSTADEFRSFLKVLTICISLYNAAIKSSRSHKS